MSDVREQGFAEYEQNEGGRLGLPPDLALYADETMGRIERPSARRSGSKATLERVIEGVVIPRLVAAHRAGALRPTMMARRVPAIRPEHVLSFANLVMTDDSQAVSAYLDGLRGRGLDLDSLYLDLLAPAARHLGTLWEEDLCDFTQVTMGLWRLHQALETSAIEFLGAPTLRDMVAEGLPNRHALLIPAPGDTHGFGLAIVTKFFRRAGWQVCTDIPRNVGDLATMVRHNSYSVVGFSLGCAARLDELAACVRAVRLATRQESIGLMLGGPLFNEHPELVAELGGDATARDGRQAVAAAEGLLALQAAKR